MVLPNRNVAIQRIVSGGKTEVPYMRQIGWVATGSKAG